METEQVVEKILSQAGAEADKILAEAKETGAEEEKQLAEQLSDYRDETRSLAETAAADKKLRMLAAARMDIRKELTAAKNAILDEVFAGAAKQISSLQEQEYQAFISSLMSKAVETGDEEVVIGKNESRIDDSLIKQINGKLGSGFKGGLHLAEDRADIEGGFILRRGNIQTNVSIEVMLAQVKEELETELGQELFS